MRAGLAAAESERDRVKGLYQGLAAQGSDAAGRAGELSKALDSEKQISSRAQAMIEVLNQQITALRRAAISPQKATSIGSRPTPRRAGGASAAS